MHCLSEKIGLNKFEKLKNQSTEIERKMKEKQQKKNDLQNEIEVINKKQISEKLKIRNRQKLEIKELLKIKMKYILTTNYKEEIESNHDDEKRESSQMEQIEIDEEEEDIDLISDLETIVGGGYDTDSTKLSAIENAGSFGHGLSKRSKRHSYTPDPEPHDLHSNDNHYMSDFPL